jgi:hypothetical protein
MTLRGKAQAALAIAALGVAPMGLATAGAGAHPSSSHTTPAQAKAYGRMCAQQGLLKNHRAAVAAGQKRTAYADCVVALAHLAHSTTAQASAQKACAVAESPRNMSPGTPELTTAGVWWPATSCWRPTGTPLRARAGRRAAGAGGLVRITDGTAALPTHGWSWAQGFRDE